MCRVCVLNVAPVNIFASAVQLGSDYTREHSYILITRA